jgi:hypothetical protein
MGLVTTLYTSTITQPGFTLLTTDRLIVKYFALKTQVVVQEIYV